MRTIQRVAFVFSLISLAFGITGFIGPLVKPSPRSRFMRMFRRNGPSWLNTQPGKQFGLFATDWMHSAAHILLAIPGLFPQIRNRYAQAYMGVMTAVFAFLAGMGWMEFGMKPGMHKVMGMNQNREDNILHTALAATGLVFSVIPLMQQMPSMSDIRDTAHQVTDKAMQKVHKDSGEKMPV